MFRDSEKVMDLAIIGLLVGVVMFATGGFLVPFWRDGAAWKVYAVSGLLVVGFTTSLASILVLYNQWRGR